MKGDRILSYLKRNSSTILTGLGAIGTVATAALAIQETPKAMKLLETAKDEKGDKLTVLEVVKTAAPAYIPAAATCVGTLLCIFGANALNKKQQAALASAYGLVSSAYQEYQRKTKEIAGEETAEQIKEAIIEDKLKVEPEDDNDVIFPGHPYPQKKTTDNIRTIYDMRTGEYYEANLEFANLTDGMEVCIIDWI